MQSLTRREFLQATAAAGVAAGTGLLAGGCGGPILEPLPEASPVTSRATVAPVLGDNLYAMTGEALKAVGGIESVVKPGETVFIKPNFLTVGMVRHNPFQVGECTKPEILIALAEACLQAGAAEVIVGDGAQVKRFDWADVTTLDGSTNMAAAAEALNATHDGTVTLACLNADSPDWDALPCPGTSLEQIYVSSLVARADRVISVPVLKTHRRVGVTLSLKNFVGATPLTKYNLATDYRVRLHFIGVIQCVLNIVRGLKPDLAIIDGSIGCERSAPFVNPGEGSTVDMRDRLGQWLMVASTDLLAADATTTRIIGQNPSDLPLLQMAYEQGLGQLQEDMIDLVDADLADLVVEWAPARIR